MASVLDVAQYILGRRGSMSGKRLQKLTYYAQAWSLAWTNHALFSERIEAWRDGPVVPALFSHHRYLAEIVSLSAGDSSALTQEEADTVDSVLAHYGELSADALIARTHAEEPWMNARRGLLRWQAGNREITQQAMRSFYAKL